MSKLVAKIPGWTQAAIQFTTPRAKTVWKYAKVEMRPPTPAEVGQAIPMAKKGFNNLMAGKFMDLSVAQCVQNTLVATEVLMWFFVGEILGRDSLIGYTV